jgi:beta-glucuronidase
VSAEKEVTVLYPRESSTRDTKNLGGIWHFKVDWHAEGEREGWSARNLEDPILMPVPASYNDITQDARLRDHVGAVWYERKFVVPSSWSGLRTIVRVGSATHNAMMWFNGHLIAQHRGGFLPFEGDATPYALYGRENRLTIRVDNELDWTTLPPGTIDRMDDFGHVQTRRRQRYFHDFFNYAGLHRPVLAYTTPRDRIDDIRVTTEVRGTAGVVHYDVTVGTDPNLVERSEGGGHHVHVRVVLRDATGVDVAACDGHSGTVMIPSVNLWEPGAPYLYSMVAILLGPGNLVVDEYELRVGVRTIHVTDRSFLINCKEFYFRGFGKHEDADVRGKGVDAVMNVKDFNLLRWIGANSFRTSHYPYGEEVMDLADELGVCVIDELPAVGLNMWDRHETVFTQERAGDGLLQTHLGQLRELVMRDGNHPCVVMWSVANEAATYEPASRQYFSRIAEMVRTLDPNRPSAIVEYALPDESHVSDLFDVVCVNRYLGWSTDPGEIELIDAQLERDLLRWHERFGKPVLVTEYGADTVAGFHSDPPVLFTEEFQCEFLERYHGVFDRLDFVIGEHVWNFADFATKQSPVRVQGNRKGIFTRQRQPKAAAHLLRSRWTGWAPTVTE